MSIARYDAIRSLAAGGISGTYAVVGSPTTHTTRAFCVTNNTLGDLFISFNGTSDNLFVPAGSFRLYDVAANSAQSTDSNGLVLQIGTQFYTKQSTAPSSGSVYIELLYAQGE